MEPTADEINTWIQQRRPGVLAAYERTTVSDLQQRSLRERPTRTPLRIVKTKLRPTESVRRLIAALVKEAIISLSNINIDEAQNITLPEVSDVYGEWISWRFDGNHNTTHSSNDVEAYHQISKETSDGKVMLYLFGGVHYLNSPANRRDLAAKLSQTNGIRCFISNYRLAPQNPFPAALIDVLVAYFSLIDPPIGSLHEPFSPSSIVLVGDSAGGALGLALIQTILTKNRNDLLLPRPFPHLYTTPLPLPVGLASLSIVVDLPLALPPFPDQARHDLMPSSAPMSRPDFPPCVLWPTTPPREYLYCDAWLAAHPLVSAATAPDWTGSPPLWFGLGGVEATRNSAAVVARTSHSQGVEVGWTEWTGMPHAWMISVPSSWWQRDDSIATCAKTCLEMLEGEWSHKSSKEGRKAIIKPTAKGLASTEKAITALTDLTPEQAARIISEVASKTKPFTGKDRKNKTNL